MNEKRNGMALAGFILGLVGLLTACYWKLAVPCGILGLIFSILALVHIADNQERGKGFAIAGLVLSILALLAVPGFLLCVSFGLLTLPFAFLGL